MMRTLFGVLALAVLAVTSPAFGGSAQPYDQAGFETAQRSNRPILVDIRASWCPTCAAQAPIVEGLAAQPQFKDLIVFHVDFDTQKSVVRAFGARSQSTLIAFKGAKETARSVGDTDPDSIGKLLRSALN